MYIIIILLVVLIDQYFKYLAVKYLKDKGFKKMGVIRLRYVENRGAAMGFLKKHPIFLKGFSLILVIILLVFEYMSYKDGASMALLLSLSFIIGGGIGNVMDRFTRGYVVDFYTFEIKKLPYFNIADFFVISGSILLLIVEMIAA